MCERCAVDEQRAAVAVSVPRIDLILPASPQRPSSQVESERWPRMQLESNFDELPRASLRLDRHNLIAATARRLSATSAR